MSTTPHWKDREEFPSHASILAHLIEDHGEQNDVELRNMNYNTLMAIHSEGGDNHHMEEEHRGRYYGSLDLIPKEVRRPKNYYSDLD